MAVKTSATVAVGPTVGIRVNRSDIAAAEGLVGIVILFKYSTFFYLQKKELDHIKAQAKKRRLRAGVGLVDWWSREVCWVWGWCFLVFCLGESLFG